MATRPQTISYCLLDSPVGLAAWLLDHDTDSYYKIADAFVDGKPSPTERPTQEGSGGKRGLSRRAFAGGAAAATGVTLLGLWTSSAAAASAPMRVPDGFGSVSRSPRLPAGFTRTFKSRFVQANGIRQHVVIGGDGPPLLLVHGWPENWYAWRFLIPALAKDFTVIAPRPAGNRADPEDPGRVRRGYPRR